MRPGLRRAPVQEQHRVPASSRSGPSYLILGAGLAGLSLADALVRRGVRAPIVIADAREEFGNDRTWCFWDVWPHPYRRLVRQRWTQWSFRAGDMVYRQSSVARPYCHLPADRFYEDVLARVRSAPNCTLMLGTTIGPVVEHAGQVVVTTSAGDLAATHVFDALATHGPTWAGSAPPPGPGVLCQRFLGWFIHAAEPVFDPSCVTLMDFDVTANGEMHFMYVLPFSTTSALVEDTTIGLHGTSAADRGDELRRYLAHRYGLSEWHVEHVEESAIPMRGIARPRGASPRLIPVGTAAGAVRPSSGYAFVRTQRQVGVLADRVAQGRPSPVPVGRRGDALLDRVFLDVLQADPEGFSRNLLALARRLPGDRFARFMMDAATPLDVLGMIAAVPTLPFLQGAARVGRDLVRR
jgi:lycopene beta-cyclase